MSQKLRQRKAFFSDNEISVVEAGQEGLWGVTTHHDLGRGCPTCVLTDWKLVKFTQPFISWEAVGGRGALNNGTAGRLSLLSLLLPLEGVVVPLSDHSSECIMRMMRVVLLGSYTAKGRMGRVVMRLHGGSRTGPPCHPFDAGLDPVRDNVLGSMLNRFYFV